MQEITQKEMQAYIDRPDSQLALSELYYWASILIHEDVFANRSYQSDYFDMYDIVNPWQINGHLVYHKIKNIFDSFPEYMKKYEATFFKDGYENTYHPFFDLEHHICILSAKTNYERRIRFSTIGIRLLDVLFDFCPFIIDDTKTFLKLQNIENVTRELIVEANDSDTISSILFKTVVYTEKIKSILYSSGSKNAHIKEISNILYRFSSEIKRKRKVTTMNSCIRHFTHQVLSCFHKYQYCQIANRLSRREGHYHAYTKEFCYLLNKFYKHTQYDIQKIQNYLVCLNFLKKDMNSRKLNQIKNLLYRKTISLLEENDNYDVWCLLQGVWHLNAEYYIEYGKINSKTFYSHMESNPLDLNYMKREIRCHMIHLIHDDYRTYCESIPSFDKLVS